jgi:tetratricopeptide (TPR) repeat protein
LLYVSSQESLKLKSKAVLGGVVPADIIGLNAGQNNYYYCNSKMSAEEVVVTDIVCCASCGIAAVDNVTLKLCDDGCDLVKYCSDNCQEIHREQHEAACKKRKAELHNKQLFTQPDSSHFGECPICCLPLSIDKRKSTLNTCCCKIICKGCDYANKKREHELGLELRCPFCRDPLVKSQETADKQAMERVKKNDPVAMTYLGSKHSSEGDYGKALKYLTKATELGYVAAHFHLGDMYYEGEGVEKDMKKAIHHFEEAAIGGHPSARGLLANHEIENGRFDRAAKHHIINANLGDEESLKCIKDLFMQGIVSKEEYAAALRGYQATVDATKSAERDEVEAASWDL